MKEAKNEAVITTKEHQSGAMEMHSFWLGKIMFADLKHDGRMSPPWCVRIGSSRIKNGWKNRDWRFHSKEQAKAAVLEYAGVTP